MISRLKFLTLLLLSGCGVIIDGRSPNTNTNVPQDIPLVEIDPQNYFESSVVPILQTSFSCASCHSLPKDGGNANLKPFSYSFMRGLLVSGAVSVSRTTLDNGVMRYLMGLEASHSGNGTFCTLASLDESPCREVIEWAKQEGLKEEKIEQTGGNPETPAPFGRVIAAGYDGVIYGWAADPDAPSTAMTVEFYSGGPRGTGTLAGTTTANLFSFTPEKPGNVAYRFTLPNELRNRTAHSIYIYGRDVNTPNEFHELTGSPVNVVAYLPKPAAQTYWTANVVPFVQNRCTGCHAVAEFQYDVAFQSYLLDPPPHLGGTATSNRFYKKMMGIESHRGGAPCGGNANSAPCNYLTSTWNQEFN